MALSFFGCWKEKVNYLGRVHKDGTGVERISKTPILHKNGVSPAANWVSALVPGSNGNVSLETVAIPVAGGQPQLIYTLRAQCAGHPTDDFSPQSLKTAQPRDVGKTATIPIPTGSALSDIPSTGLPPREKPSLEGARLIHLTNLSAGPGFNVYTYTKTKIQGNLFRIPLH